MTNYIGIDLGTTNSSIAIYDGETIKICKSPEQNDVTPSALVIDKRGNKFVGQRAYDIAPLSPDNSAILFKRLMGSNTKIKFAFVNEEKTPEECSAEVLKTLFGYLPEEIRKSNDIGTVITIPAAFNQMQKDATKKAAKMAGIGKVALMQEPVAAIMSVIKKNNSDGIFLIYDLGGGTLDIAIAENISGRVNLLANGGIQMCGGRDIDRAIFENKVIPWLKSNFILNDDFVSSAKYKKLIKQANWAVEKAKIELSSKEETNIVLSEIEIGTTDESNREIYLEIPLSRKDVEPLIDEKVKESIEVIKDTLQKASLSNKDISKIIFIGGPTNYKPLRDKICSTLKIEGCTEINPMTAVAEGAAIFAESIDWNSIDNSKKATKALLTSNSESLQISFMYASRTPENKAKVIVIIKENIYPGCEFQINSLDADWTSGRQKLENRASLNLYLPKNGENKFEVCVFNSNNEQVNIPNNKILITKTAAIVDSITANHSVGIAVKSKSSSVTELEWLVRTGDSLPKKGTAKFKAVEPLIAGSKNTINFKLFEGEIPEPVTDNRDIGTLKIIGTDIDTTIEAGSELICNYEMLDSGNIILHISIPSIKTIIDSTKNFYSPQEGQIDFDTAAEKISYDAKQLSERIKNIENNGIADSLLVSIKNKINRAKELTNNFPDSEKNQEAQERLLEARRLLAKIRKKHIKEIRTIELNIVVKFFNEYCLDNAKISEKDSFEALNRTAKSDIERNNREFEVTIDEMRFINFRILNRQDWFVINRFNKAINNPFNYSDKNIYHKLIEKGKILLNNYDIDELRNIMVGLSRIKINDDLDLTSLEDVNITKV